MNYYAIYTALKEVAENNPEKLVDVWNERCYAQRYYDDVVYPNDVENLRMMLPTDPEEAFAMGRNASDSYNYTDEWLSMDGYGRPVTCGTWNLTERFIGLGDLAYYLRDNMDEDELKDLFEDLGVDDEDDEEEEDEE